MTRRTAVIVGIYLATGLALTTLSRVLDDRLMTETGLVQSFDTGVDDERTALFTRTAAAIDLAFLEDDADLPRRFFEVRWDGVWHVPDGRQVDVFAGGDDLVAIRIDDELVLERSFAVGTHTTSARVILDAGLHRLSVHYVQRGGGYSMNVQWAPAGESARPFEPDRLFPVSPEPEQITRNERLLSLRRLVAVFWITPPLLFLLWVGVPPVMRFGRYRMPALGRRGSAAYVSLAGDHSAAVTRDVEPHRKTWTVAGAVVVLLLFGLPPLHRAGVGGPLQRRGDLLLRRRSHRRDRRVADAGIEPADGVSRRPVRPPPGSVLREAAAEVLDCRVVDHAGPAPA